MRHMYMRHMKGYDYACESVSAYTNVAHVQ